MLQTKPSKFFVESELAKRLAARPNQRVRFLEVGSGTSEIASQLLQRFPDFEYVGIEPDAGSVSKARARLGETARATIIHGFGYPGLVHPALEQPFDLVFSLSVLEHVKQLETFFAFCAMHTKIGGEMVHLYDLGHALYPSSWKEWLQTRLCGTKLLRFFPEDKVARYLATADVKCLCEAFGSIQRITCHNMPNHVAFLKLCQSREAVQAVVECEAALYPQLTDLSVRERLFPSVCFWLKKA